MPSLVEQGLKHHDAGELGRAEQCYLDAIAANASDAVALKLLAVLAAERGQDDDAIAYAEAAIAAKPEVAEYRHLAGRLRARRNDFIGAVEALQQAIARANPPPTAMLCDLGLCFQRLERWQDADPVFAQVLAGEPSNLTALHGRALTALAAGRLPDAQSLYERMLQVDPTHAQAKEGLQKVQGWLRGEP